MLLSLGYLALKSYTGSSISVLSKSLPAIFLCILVKNLDLDVLSFLSKLFLLGVRVYTDPFKTI